MRTDRPPEATGGVPLRTIAAIVRSGGARVRTGGAGGVAEIALELVVHRVREYHEPVGRLNQLLPLAKEHFDDGEDALAAVVGQYETKRAGADAIKTGIMIATDRRVLFYAKRLFGYQLEHFPYRAISSFEQGVR